MAQPTAVTIPSRYSIVPVAFTWTAGTTSATLMDWLPGDILLAKNTHGSLAKTITIVSKPKNKRQDYTITSHSIAFGTYRIFPRFPPQDDEVLSVTCESADILLARLSTAPQPT